VSSSVVSDSVLQDVFSVSTQTGDSNDDIPHDGLVPHIADEVLSSDVTPVECEILVDSHRSTDCNAEDEQ